MIPFWKLNFPLLFDDYLIQFCRIWRPLLLFYFILVRSTDVLVQANQTLWDFSSPLCVEASKPRFRKLSVKADFYTAASAFLWSLSLSIFLGPYALWHYRSKQWQTITLSQTHTTLSPSQKSSLVYCFRLRVNLKFSLWKNILDALNLGFVLTFQLELGSDTICRTRSFVL